MACCFLYQQIWNLYCKWLECLELKKSHTKQSMCIQTVINTQELIGLGLIDNYINIVFVPKMAPTLVQLAPCGGKGDNPTIEQS